jgi:hypothetical protein
MKYQLMSITMASIITNRKKKCVGVDVEKLELLSTVGQNVKWCNHSGKESEASKKKKK